VPSPVGLQLWWSWQHCRALCFVSKISFSVCVQSCISPSASSGGQFQVRYNILSPSIFQFSIKKNKHKYVGGENNWCWSDASGASVILQNLPFNINAKRAVRKKRFLHVKCEVGRCRQDITGSDQEQKTIFWTSNDIINAINRGSLLNSWLTNGISRRSHCGRNSIAGIETKLQAGQSMHRQTSLLCNT
jgi:hypothetical protein